MMKPLSIALLLLTPICASAQTTGSKPVEGSQPAASSGATTGGAHPATYDTEHRPITAGGFVKSGPVVFQDIAARPAWTGFITPSAHPRRTTFLKRSAPA